jgi:hypothetical protein
VRRDGGVRRGRRCESLSNPPSGGFGEMTSTRTVLFALLICIAVCFLYSTLVRTSKEHDRRVITLTPYDVESKCCILRVRRGQAQYEHSNQTHTSTAREQEQEQEQESETDKRKSQAFTRRFRSRSVDCSFSTRASAPPISVSVSILNRLQPLALALALALGQQWHRHGPREGIRSRSPEPAWSPHAARARARARATVLVLPLALALEVDRWPVLLASRLPETSVETSLLHVASASWTRRSTPRRAPAEDPTATSNSPLIIPWTWT